ncbi:MAG: hypothetical protein HKP58_10625 [Desulfatitalea sp.]|nr:hypothetical protein [Desulfatitalea sp.]
MVRTIDFFMPLAINRLLPTHLDWTERFGPLINQVAKYRLPIGYLSTGAAVPEALQLATSKQIAALLLAVETARDGGNENLGSVTVVQQGPETTAAIQYVANCNSDIFHHNECKSVARISMDNAVMFKDPTEAMDQGFKPCRMCCMALLTPKPIERSARSRFAGGRK